MTLDIRNDGSSDFIILALKGRIDHANSIVFSEKLEKYLSQCTTGSKPLILDISGIDYISSAGLRALMIATRRVKAQGGKFAVACLQPVVQEVFSVSKFHLVLACFDSVAAAKQALL